MEDELKTLTTILTGLKYQAILWKHDKMHDQAVTLLRMTEQCTTSTDIAVLRAQTNEFYVHVNETLGG